MQETSDAFDTAVTTHRTWMPPRMRTDWLLDGYDGDGSIDDLTRQASSEWAVSHDLDDGYPSQVSFVSGNGAPELEAELAGRNVGGVPMTPAAYWSPLRLDSPIGGIERDTQPVTLDMGLVTADGPEYVRIFTGQVTNTPVKGGKAHLKALSAARIALMRPVLPPAFASTYFGGLHASWVVSWCLFECGIYAGAKIREGSTTLYYPMHGSFRRFLDGDAPDGNLLTGENINIIEATQANPIGELSSTGELDWVEGPYVAAPDLQLRTALSRRAYQINPPFTYGDGQASAFTQAGNAGRLEMWVRGDQADVNTAPGGSGSASRLTGLQLTNASGGASAALGVNTSRQVYVEVYDGTNRRTLTGATLPTDGAWHFVGAAYDMTADKLWTCLDNSSTSTGASMVTSALPATTDAFDPAFLLSYLPFSDVTFSTGAQANVDSYPLWRNDSSFAPTARVVLSPHRLVTCTEKQPREAWELISGYARAELAMLRCDENDFVQYLPLAWWVKDAQQALTDSIDTQRNAAPFDIDYDPSRIRNAVTVSYSETTIPTWSANAGIFRRVYGLPNNTEIRLEANSTTDIVLPFSTPAAELSFNIDTIDGPTAAVMPVDGAWITANTALDGTGSYMGIDSTGLSDGTITATIVAWQAGQATVRLKNSTAIPVYLANDNNVPALVLAGLTADESQTYVTDIDATSAATRGQRAISVSASAIQTSEAARRLARNVKMGLRNPRATVGDESSGVNVIGDPRRQPGDLTELHDTETGVSGGRWRLQSVRHGLRDAGYAQQLVVREVLPVGFVGVNRVGQCLVGPNRG